VASLGGVPGRLLEVAPEGRPPSLHDEIAVEKLTTELTLLSSFRKSILPDA
jgi:hypothetical protein